jgi:rhodanese-related sulfurtransferase
MLFFRRRTGRITPGEARNRVQAGAAVLVDVRERVEWNAGHAPEAVHLPLSRLMAGAQLPGSAAGHRSRQAARLLAARGVDVVDVRGGMTAWERAGLPVTGRRARGRSA